MNIYHTNGKTTNTSDLTDREAFALEYAEEIRIKFQNAGIPFCLSIYAKDKGYIFYSFVGEMGQIDFYAQKLFYCGISFFEKFISHKISISFHKDEDKDLKQ